MIACIYRHSYIMADGERLKSMGLKATGPRLRILTLFEQAAGRHLTADEVYHLLRREHEDIGLATVYRVLTQFEQVGLLIRHHFDNEKAVYELNKGGHHDHLLCVQCGRVEEFFDAEIEKRQRMIVEERGFRLHAHCLYLYVDCTKVDCPYRSREKGANAESASGSAEEEQAG